VAATCFFYARTCATERRLPTYVFSGGHRTAIGLLSVALTAAPAAAQSIPLPPSKPAALKTFVKPPPAMVLPPAECDHPYTAGQLFVTVVDSQADIRDKCESTRRLDVALACSQKIHRKSDPSVNGCWIVIANKDVIEAAGYVYDVVMRHEIGHCNGWLGDHPNAQPWEDWAD
jgi:hypothetical protein